MFGVGLFISASWLPSVDFVGNFVEQANCSRTLLTAGIVQTAVVFSILFYSMLSKQKVNMPCKDFTWRKNTNITAFPIFTDSKVFENGTFLAPSYYTAMLDNTKL